MKRSLNLDVKCSIMTKEYVLSKIEFAKAMIEKYNAKANLRGFENWDLQNFETSLKSYISLLEEMNNLPLDEYIVIGMHIANGRTIDDIVYNK